MFFNQGVFWITFSAFLLLYYLVPNRNQKYILLLGSLGYAFYQSVVSGVVLISVVCLSYFGAIWIRKYDIDKARSRRRMIWGIVAVALILFLFKYLYFSVDIISGIAGCNLKDIFVERIGYIVVPLGISFYTLRAIAYLVNVYHGAELITSWVDYCAVLSYFPLLPSGPVERESGLVNEIRKEKRFDFDNICSGMQIYGIGLFMKLVIADRLSVAVNNVYSDYTNYSGAICLIAMVMYSMQIYCDFCGYSYMAIGVSRMLDIKIVDNFERPYLATSIKEFWRRWHISFSTWLKEYIYIPLGGNRKGKFRQNINLVITFLVSGIWHGASINFIIWGGLHGLFQVIGNITNSTIKTKEDSAILRVIRTVATFIIVTFAWLFFRMNSVADAVLYIRNILERFDVSSVFQGQLYEMGWGRMQIFGVLLACIVVITVEILNEKNKISLNILNRMKIQVRWGIYYIVMMWMVVAYVQLYGISQNAGFIYANF